VLWRYLVRWAVAAVAVPVAAAGARRLGHAVEARRGSNAASRTLARTADTLETVGGRRRRRRR
jgi:hypothetical protein